jgi:hypothetical protein
MNLKTSVLIAVLVLYTAWDASAQDKGVPPMDTHPAMLAFSRAIRGIDKGLTNGRADSIRLHARAILTAPTDDLAPHINADYPDEFARQLQQLRSIATQLDTHAQHPAHAAQLYRQLRSTCTSCHVKFLDEEKRFFPAIDNIVAGQVRIFSIDGEEREDRSDVLVFIDRVAGDFSPPFIHPALSQRDRRFTPHVLPVLKGTTVDFPNDDRIFHNVFSLSQNQPFDLDVYPPGESRSLTLNQPGWIKIYCHIHAQMTSHILVLDNPFFALTDERGRFVIPELADGEYLLRTWHEFGGQLQQQIAVEDGQLLRVELKVREDRVLIQHKNKFGKNYGGQYR